jgi:Uma2 family endonuclease
MATIQTRYTPEDLLKITDRPMPELVDGQLVERNMGQKADAIASRIGRILGNYAEDRDLGLINGSQGGYQIFPDDPDRVRIPDVSFTPKGRLPQEGIAEGHSRVVPDLVVEVISPNDTAADLMVKVREYLNAGIPLVWVANPDDQSVGVYRADGSAALLGPNDTIDGGAVLPGFSCQVAVFFALPTRG